MMLGGDYLHPTKIIKSNRGSGMRTVGVVKLSQNGTPRARPATAPASSPYRHAHNKLSTSHQQAVQLVDGLLLACC
jgi:hypothetical protein